MAITKDNKIEASDINGIVADIGNINSQLTNLNSTLVRTIDHHEAVDNNVTVLDTYNVTNPVTPGSDTVEDWQALGSGTYWFNNNNTSTGYPESQYGFIINIRGDTHSDIFQIWKPQRDQKPYYRGGNASGWSAWNMFGGTASLVATYSSGTSWYRKYSDGWIEQGGRTAKITDTNTTITFPLAFSNTNYTFVHSPYDVSYRIHIYSNNRTTTSISVGNYSVDGTYGCYHYWYACGY